MNDTQRKLLTEFLGEQWEPYKVTEWPYYTEEYGKEYSLFPIEGVEPEVRYVYQKHRTFDNSNDMIALKDKLVEVKKWREFLWEHHLSCSMYKDWDDFIDWLFTPDRFCQLVANYLEGK